MKLLVKQLSPRSCYFHLVGSNIFFTAVFKKKKKQNFNDTTDCIILGRYESRLNLLYNLCCRTPKRIIELYSQNSVCWCTDRHDPSRQITHFVQRVYVWRSRNNYCGEKAMSITKSGCVSVDLAIQHAKRMRFIALCGLSGFIIIFHIISSNALFSE